MWRSFFYASGIMLIVLGLECVAVARFAFSPDSSLPQFAKPWFTTYPTELNSPANYAATPPSGGYGQLSQYGPSRFNNNPFQAASSSSQGNSANPFNLPAMNGSMRTPQPTISSIFQTEEWMPWSLIAAGTIVTIYTHSLYRNQPAT